MLMKSILIMCVTCDEMYESCGKQLVDRIPSRISLRILSLELLYLEIIW